jgi:SAM-dependent methyltransferase
VTKSTRPLIVPDRFSRNSPTVTGLMTPEQSGIWLLERMRRQIGLSSYAATKMLDFGCGVRFSQTILNLGLPVGRYVGVDCYAPMIEFLQGAVRDPRFAFHHLDAHNPFYNPGGRPMSSVTRLPMDERDFDLICLFSVITHQSPADSESLFELLHRHVAPTGRLFFTCFLDPEIASYEDRSPDRNCGRCCYHPAFLSDLVSRCGWRILATAAAEAPLIGDTFVCCPTTRDAPA